MQRRTTKKKQQVTEEDFEEEEVLAEGEEVEADDFDDLDALNEIQADQRILANGEFEKEGFGEEDFEDHQPEMDDNAPLEYEGDEFEQFDENEYQLIDPAEIDINTETVNASDTQILEMKIQKILKILSDFNNLREEGVPRSDYVTELQELYCQLYSYNTELIELFMGIFGPHECSAFLDSMEEQRPVTIRTNTLKSKRRDLAQALMQRKINLEPVGDWSKVGLKINESRIPVGATPEYLSGHYMLQSACSFLPVLSLAPRPGERILDMAAAPGGKTSYIAQMMKNKGVLVANDVKKERLKSLHFNLQRLGVSNCTVINYDGRRLPEVIGGFDRVLLDAPCTGLGVISRDPSIKSNRFLLDVRKNGHIQKELLRAAVDCCKPGGIVVYSTCSISVEENEAVIDYITRVRHVKVRDTGLPIENKGYTKYKEYRFNPKVSLTRRVYPHVHNMDGFFIAKLQKIANGPKGDTGEGEQRHKAELNRQKKLKVKGKKSQRQNNKAAAEGKDGEGATKVAKKAKKKGPKSKRKAGVPNSNNQEGADSEENLTRKQKNKLRKNFDKNRKVNKTEGKENQAEGAAQEESQEQPAVDKETKKVAKKPKTNLKKRKPGQEAQKPAKKATPKPAADPKGDTNPKKAALDLKKKKLLLLKRKKLLAQKKLKKDK